jgi:hypothetical protein
MVSLGTPRIGHPPTAYLDKGRTAIECHLRLVPLLVSYD